MTTGATERTWFPSMGRIDPLGYGHFRRGPWGNKVSYFISSSKSLGAHSAMYQCFLTQYFPFFCPFCFPSTCIPLLPTVFFFPFAFLFTRPLGFPFSRSLPPSFIYVTIARRGIHGMAGCGRRCWLRGVVFVCSALLWFLSLLWFKVMTKLTTNCPLLLLLLPSRLDTIR